MHFDMPSGCLKLNQGQATPASVVGSITVGAAGTNHNGREWLQQNDPGMYAFLVEMYERSHDRKGRLVEGDS